MKRLSLFLLFLIPIIAMGQQSAYVKSKEIIKKGEREYIVHKVMKGQTLYAISKLYEIELDSLMYFNPEIKDGLKTGAEILIPQFIKSPVKTTHIVEEKKVIKEKKDSLPAGIEKLSCDSGFHAHTFEVAFMLPLYLSEMDSIPSENMEDKFGGLDLKSLRFVQFYEGALMAVDSMIAMGMSVNLHIYDIDEDTNKIKKLLKEPDLKRMDLIIGLLYGTCFQKLASFAKSNKIPVVNPLSNKIQHIENNPYVFLANPTISTMADQIAVFMARKYFDNIIILLNSGKANEKKSMAVIQDQLVNEFMEMGKPTENIHLFSGEGDIAKIPPVMSGTKINALVILSNDELFVANVMLNVKEWSASHQLVVFGMPGWLDFKSVESKLLVQSGFHSFGTCLVDYHNSNTQKFIRQYRNQYKTEPIDLAFQGFDVSFYFLSSLMKYGKSFMKCTLYYPYQGMQTRYIFRQTGNNGYDNNWLNIFRIQDYQVINARD